MEKERIQFGLSKHFPRHQWSKNPKYFKTKVSVAEVDLKLHGPSVKTAFQNVIAFLKSIYDGDVMECVELYYSILKEDSNNLNALVGLYECITSRGEKDKCIKHIQSIMSSDIQKQAIPKALLEIGLALSLLVPAYHYEDKQSVNAQQTDSVPAFDEYQTLDFTTSPPPMDIDLYTDCNIVLKRRVYSSLRYFQEGLHRFADVQTENDKPELLVWNFFLAMTYNRLDNWVSYTRGSSKLRKEFTLKSLECFCEIIIALNEAEDKYNRMYYHRCLAYIGQILTSRKELIMYGEEVDFVPECFSRVSGHFLRTIWDHPTDAFERAMEYGYDAVIYTRNAKRLLHEGKLDSVIEIIDGIFNADDSVNWFSAAIRMSAYKLKYMQCFNEARTARDYSTLTTEYLLEAEKSGKYCFDTHASANDLSQYATILRWLGIFPDGKKVINETKIQFALVVLDRVYKEQGCHTHFKVHKTRAECHADMEEMDEAIKYIIWSLNSCPDNNPKPSIAFRLLIEYLLKKIKKDTSMHDEEKRKLHKQMKYYIEVEIKRCHDLIKNAEGQLADPLINTAKLLLDKCDKKTLDQVKSFVNNASSAEQRRFFKELDDRYSMIFRNVNGWCRSYPEQIKSFLDFIASLTSLGPIHTMVTMSLICLGRQHTDWTRHFNRKWKAKPEDENVLELCSPNLDCLQDVSRYDFLVIHAPEDKEWVLYTLLPEMEDRPKSFKGCVPDRDFLRGDTFEKNIDRCLQMTSKVVLVITAKFFERVYEVLQKAKIITTLEKMHAEGTIDAIALFSEAIQLDKTKHSQLMKFENIDASGSYLDWNCLRVLLVQMLPPVETKRPPVIWEDAGDEAHVRPRENEDDKYRLLEEDILPYGVPAAMYIIHKNAYIIGYDGALKVPRWVAHKIDRKTPRGIVSRKTHHKQLRTYHPDLKVPAQARSAEKDYAGRSDIDQGHVTPLADHSSKLELARETNFMTNMVPELKNNFLWNRLEEHCRDKLTEDFDTIHVISGTLFLSKQTDMETDDRKQDGLAGSVSKSSEAGIDDCTQGLQDFHECTQVLKDLQLETPPSKRHSARTRDSSTGRKFVTFEVIGRNEVAVPTHLYKVIIAKSSNEKDNEPCIGAFMVPNQPLYDAELEELSISISKLESWLGIDLFRNMRKEMKKMSVPTLPTAFFPKVYRMRKMIRYVDTLDGLQSVWNGLSDELKNELQTVYEEKKTRLMKKK